MLPETFTLKDDFPPATYEQWRALVEADLKGVPFDQALVTHLYDGIDLQPLYSRRDELDPRDAIGQPGAPPFIRSSRPIKANASRWDLRQEYEHPDLMAANRAILDDLAGGVTSLLLRLDSAACHGLDPDDPVAANLAAQDGLLAYSVDDLDTALAGVDLKRVPVTLDAGAAFLPAAASLVVLWQRRGVSPDQARGAFNADPLAALASNGNLPVSSAEAISELGNLAAWTSKYYSDVFAVGVDTSPYHNAGAPAAHDIAFAMASAVEYLRAMAAAGMDIDSAAHQVRFKFGLGTHHFLAICKLRAARRLWSRVVEASGGSASAGAMRINARTGSRVLTKRDPYVNLLRNTVAVFAAVLGGADSITSVPFDSAVGQPNEFSRRVARNTALVLEEEAHLNRVIDPAGGSWYLDRLTQQLAQKAWEIFQHIERTGGMLHSLASGWVAKQIDVAHAARNDEFASGKIGIIGVTSFPDKTEEPLVRAEIEIDSLRKRAAARLTKSPCDRKLLDTLAKAASNVRMSAAIDAATSGASIAQMARALKFHEQSTKIPPLKLQRFATPFE